jgi:CubicO group peptidase (beta-lactamase class C family)
MKKKLLIALFIFIGIGIILRIVVYPKLEVVSGISAKNLCSCLYVSGLTKEEAEKTDLGFSLLWLANNQVDAENKAVISNVMGMHPKKAVYTEGRGCALEYNTKIEAFNPQSNVTYGPEIWTRDFVSGSPEMEAVLQKAFDAPGETKLNTRGVVVIHKGEIIGEAYAEGIDMDTPLLGWSMTKSVTGILAGILAKDGFWNLDDPMDIPEWKADERKDITLNNLMQMSSGLEWEENYGSRTTATEMLYASPDLGAYAQSLPLQFEPGTEWVYSSGTTNIIARKMADTFSDMNSYQQFPYDRLLGPIGANTFTLETDASGHFMGSSYGYASARDWGKLGLLMLQEGNWNGEQIIDSTWVDYCHATAPASDGAYGGQFWLNRNETHPNYDKNAYFMNGFHSQQVSIHPDRDLVVVRLGVTYERGAFDFDGWMKEIYEVVDK